MNKMIVEIRGGEGGDDAKLLVEEQLGIYLRWCQRTGTQAEIVDVRPGLAILQLIGEKADSRFTENECGGHRWQRVPPTEKRGRVHTSSITVACLPVPSETETSVTIRDSDLEWAFCRGSGKGGQHRNKTNSAVQLHHRISGITVRVDNERSQKQNKLLALEVLRSRLVQMERQRSDSQRNADRRSQTGVAMRGDKRRTIALQRDQVTDHRTGKRAPTREYLRGNIEVIW